MTQKIAHLLLLQIWDYNVGYNKWYGKIQVFDVINDESHAYYSTINNLCGYNEKITVDMLAFYSTSHYSTIVYITELYKNSKSG